MKNVLFVTESGSGKGLGHLFRCLALSQAFENRGYATEFVLWGGSLEAALLQGRKVSLFNWIKNTGRLTACVSKADFLVLDSYSIGERGINRIAAESGPAVFLDDNNRINYPDGTVLNWNLFADDLNYRKRSGLSFLLGPDYIALRKPFWLIPAKPVKNDIESVMVSFGGDDSKQMTLRVLDYLNRNHPALKKYVVIGPNFHDSHSIRTFPDSQIEWVLSPGGEGMREIMLKSDIAVSSGGQILNELARAGVPTVAVSVAGNQMRNVLAWEKAGFLGNAGDWNDGALMKNLDLQFLSFHDKQRRIRSSRSGQHLIPGNGADRIIDFLEEGGRL